MRLKWLWMALAVLLVAGGLSLAAPGDQTSAYSATKVRVINAGNPQRWDTLVTVPTGQRLVLLNFSALLHDSNAAAGFRVTFSSMNSAKTYLKILDSLTAGQAKNMTFAGPVVFPKDSTIKVSYYTTTGVVDSLFAVTTYRVEAAP